MGFTIIDIASVTLLDNNNAILKHSRPKVTSAQNLLSSGIPRHMSTTCSNMVFV